MRSWPANARDQHQQRALRQVEVGEQQVDDAKSKPGVMKRSVSPRDRLRAPRLGAAQRRRLERAQAGRADRDDAAAALRARARSPPRRAGADLEALAVHDVLGEALAAHRLERAGADVQRDRACARRRARRARRAARRRSAAPRSAPRPRPAARRTPSGSARRRRRRRRARCRAAAARGRGARAARAARRESAGGTATSSLPARPSTSASKASAKRTTLPAFGDLLARSCASTTSPASTRSTSASTAPPLALTPNRRALITAVSLKTSRSPARSSVGQVADVAVARAARRAPSSRREALRSAAGCWAISSRGSAKSKSLRAKARGRRHRRAKFSHGPSCAARIEGERRQRRGRDAAPLGARPGPRQARPGARHRPRAAPAAALRGRDARRADRRRCTTATTGQVEGVVTDSRIQFRPRRQLVVKIADDSGDLVLRFLHFYPSQQKTLAAGKRVRVRGEARGGFFGLEMVHPAFKVVTPETPLPTALTPVYPSTVQLSQAVLRKAVAAGRRARRPRRAAARRASCRPGCRPCARRSIGCTSRRPGSTRPRSRTARIRPGSASSSRSCSPSSSRSCSRSASASASARRVLAAARGALHERFLAALPFALTRAQRRVAAEIDADLGARRADAPPAAGRRRLRQDGRRRARRGARDRRRLAVRADGADRDPRRAAPEEAGRLARAARRHRRLAHRQPEGQEARRDAGAGRVGRGRPRRRHARGDRGAGPLRRLGLAIIDEQHRFGVAQRLALRAKLHDQGDARAAPADDERDADPAHAGDDALRRPRRQHHRRAAARAHAGRHQALRRHPPRRGDRAHPRRGRARPAGLLGLPAGRRIGGARPEERDRDARRALRGAARQDDRPAARPHAGGREGGGDVALRRRPDRRCWSRRR